MISLSKTKKIITDEKKLADLFNSHYINIAKISSGIKSETISSTCNINNTDEIQHIVNLYKDHLATVVPLDKAMTTIICGLSH